jgi:hypothetical protein
MSEQSDNPFKDLIVALSGGGVDFIIAGGVAAILHGVPRVTLDLDISVDMRPENIRRLIQTMSGLGLVPRAPVPPETLLHPGAIEKIIKEKGALVFTFLDPKDPLRHVDVFLTQELSYEALAPDAPIRKLDGYDVRVVSAKHLLRLKQAIRPPRDKDILDIAMLKKIVERQDD